MTRPDAHEVSTAYHEAGHAWLTYWHFVRKEWCRGIELTLNPSDDELGLCMARGLRAPDLVCWSAYTARAAAGRVAEGLYAVREGVWTWERWEASNRESFAKELADLRDGGDESSGDLAQWFHRGHALDLPVTFDDYWAGWEEAEDLLRLHWPTVDRLARGLCSKGSLATSEVLAICEGENEA